MSDDDYHYQNERRNHRLKVGLAIGGIFLSLTMLVVKFALKRDRDREFREAIATQQMLADLPRGPAVDLPAAPPVDTPIAWALEIDGKRHDIVAGKPFRLDDNAAVEVKPTPTWTETAPAYHFEHASALGVLVEPEVTIASREGLTLRVQAFSAKDKEADSRALLEEMVTVTGMVRDAPEPAERTIAGKKQTGKRYDTVTTARIETYFVKLGKQPLGVMIYRFDPSRSTNDVDALLASIAPGPGKPGPLFEAKIGDAAPALLTPDVAATIGKHSVSLKKRPTVLHAIGSLVFEHPHELIASSVANGLMSMASLTNDRVTMQLADLQTTFTVDELAQSLGAIGKDGGPVERTFGTTKLHGKKVILAAGVVTEIFVFDRDGFHLAATLQYSPDDEQSAVALATPVITSLRGTIR